MHLIDAHPLGLNRSHGGDGRVAHRRRHNGVGRGGRSRRRSHDDCSDFGVGGGIQPVKWATLTIAQLPIAQLPMIRK